MELKERTSATGLHAHVLDQVERLHLPKDSRILDLGCGTGALLARLQMAGYVNLTGIDIAPPRECGGIRFMEADLDDLHADIPAGSVDLILAVEVLEHVENMGALLNRLAMMLAPKGRLLVTTPNVHSVEARVRYFLKNDLKQFDKIGDPTHVYPVFVFTFQRVLGRHGFTVDRSWAFPEDGSSPTSRKSLRFLAWLARLSGVRGDPDGDHLCLLISKTVTSTSAPSKKEALTMHY